MITADNLPVGFRASQVGVVGASGSNPTIILEWAADNVGPYIQSEDGTTSTLVTETIMTGYASSDPNSASETFYLTGGALVVGATRQIQYTATVRGLPNGQKSNPPTTEFVANKILHSNESFYVVNEAPWVKSLEAAFVSGSTEDTATTGEVIGARKVVAIDSTDGLLYLFDDSNTDHVLVGISKAAYASGVTATYTLTGGRATGFSGLTAGAIQYASTSVAGDITEVSTPFPIGNASADGTYINVFISPGAVTIASQAEAEAGANNVNVMTPLRTKQATSVNLEAAEALDANDFVCAVQYSPEALATQTQAIGFSAALDEQFFELIGNGTDFTELAVILAKTGTPTDDIQFRIEGDDNGEPDGNLVTNGSATRTCTTLTTSPVKYTITLAGTVNLVNGTRYWLRMKRSGAYNTGNRPQVYGAGVLGAGFWSTLISGVSTRSTTQSPFIECTGIKTSGVCKNTIDLSTGAILLSSSFLGSVKDSVAVGDTASINTNGKVSGQTGLVAGNGYYIDGQTPTLQATIANGRQLTAISDTEALVTLRF